MKMSHCILKSNLRNIFRELFINFKNYIYRYVLKQKSVRLNHKNLPYSCSKIKRNRKTIAKKI